MSHASDVWKHSKLIIGLLLVLFFVSVVVDSVLWYTVHKSAVAQKTLNEIIASQPQAPKTDEDKAELLDALAAAHATAVTQAAAQSPKKLNTPSNAHPPSDQTKINLLNSLHKK